MTVTTALRKRLFRGENDSLRNKKTLIIDGENIPPQLESVDSIAAVKSSLCQIESVADAIGNDTSASPNSFEFNTYSLPRINPNIPNSHFDIKKMFHCLRSVKRPGYYTVDYSSTDVMYRQYEDSKSEIGKPYCKRTCCLMCEQSDKKDLKTCCVKDCHSRFHLGCIQNMDFGGYTALQASVGRGFQCPLHHCQKCFAEGFHQHCFRYDKLIRCSQCVLGYHECCIPAGCSIDENSQIVCPRHVKAVKFHFRPKNYCFECKTAAKGLVNCSNCCRSYHATCNPYEEIQLSKRRCSYCAKNNFVRVGEHVFAQADNFQFHFGVAVDNDEYPVNTERKNIKSGFFVVRWYENNFLRYSIVSHYRCIPASKDIWYYKSKQNYPLLKKLKGYDEMFNEAVLYNSTVPLALDKFLSPNYSKNCPVRNADVNRYTSEQLRRDVRSFLSSGTHSNDMCECDSNDPERCSTDLCLNRSTYIECPEACQAKAGGCKNRFIANKENLLKNTEIFLTDRRGFGMRTLVDLPANTFIGEYCGEIVTDEEMSRRNQKKHLWRSMNPAFYAMRFLKKWYIDAEFYGSSMRYLNHSCDPNCITQMYQSDKAEAHVCIFSTRAIKAGEELTFSYAQSRRENYHIYECYCGSKNCKGKYSA